MIKQVIAVRADLNMNRGKIAAQVAHASMLFMIDRMRHLTSDEDKWSKFEAKYTADETEWLCGNSGIENWNYGSMTKIVVSVPGDKELLDLWSKALHAKLNAYMVKDKTLDTETCVAIGPNDALEIDKLTRAFPLLKDTAPDITQMSALVRRFLNILEIKEESDSGTIFSPVYLSSCRVMLTIEMNRIMKELDRLTK